MKTLEEIRELVHQFQPIVRRAEDIVLLLSEIDPTLEGYDITVRVNTNTIAVTVHVLVEDEEADIYKSTPWLGSRHIELPLTYLIMNDNDIIADYRKIRL